MVGATNRLWSLSDSWWRRLAFASWTRTNAAIWRLLKTCNTSRLWAIQGVVDRIFRTGLRGTSSCLIWFCLRLRQSTRSTDKWCSEGALFRFKIVKWCNKTDNPVFHRYKGVTSLFLGIVTNLPNVSVNLWNWMRTKMLPSPSKFHYTVSIYYETNIASHNLWLPF